MGQEAKNRGHLPLQEKFHRGILKVVRKNISDTLQNNGMKFFLIRAKWGISRLLSDGERGFALLRHPRVERLRGRVVH